MFENKSNKSEAAVIREMKKVFLHIPRPERVEFMLALLPKLVCAPTKVIRKPTSPLVVLLGCPALYAALLVQSRRWMGLHSYGPAEWLLRAFTLLRWPAWQRTAHPVE